MNLKEKRVLANITQTELAERMGVSQTAIALWENGRAMPSSDKLPMLAKIFGCTIDELFASE